MELLFIFVSHGGNSDLESMSVVNKFLDQRFRSAWRGTIPEVLPAHPLKGDGHKTTSRAKRISMFFFFKAY